MSNVTQRRIVSFPILGIMILVLFVGKVFEITPTLATMSWLWVFAPVLIPFGLLGVLFLIMFVLERITK